jgi:multiple sugar transport system permease protein
MPASSAKTYRPRVSRMGFGGGRRSGRKALLRAGLYIAAALVVLVTLAPFYWLFITSVSPTVELLDKPPHWIPRHLTFDRYRQVLRSDASGQEAATLYSSVVVGPVAMFRRSMANSLIVSLGSTGICLLAGALAAFAFARFRFAGRKSLYYLFVVFQMLPPTATIIAIYFLVRRFRLSDSLVALIVTYTSFNLIYVIWTMTGYFRSIPVELEEAAQIDGCSRLQVLRKIILPLSAPGLVGAGTLSFLMCWNEFMFALTLANTGATKTFPVILSEFTTQYSVDYGLMATGAIVGSIPPVVFSLLFQRFMVQGLTGGAIKG